MYDSKIFVKDLSDHKWIITRPADLVKFTTDQPRAGQDNVVRDDSNGAAAALTGPRTGGRGPSSSSSRRPSRSASAHSAVPDTA